MYSDRHVSNLVNDYITYRIIYNVIVFIFHFYTIQYIIDLTNICFRNELSINRGTIHYHYFTFTFGLKKDTYGLVV